MIRLAVAVMIALSWLGQSAQAQDPQVSFALDADTVVVGQPLTLQIKVLVPTWMPDPAVFPTIEVPSLMVRLPERATTPTSETVDGDTWSGVRRSYRLTPLAAGTFTLPEGEIVVSYADPDNSDPVEFRARLPDIAFTATIPAGARGLNPPIIANGFALEQTLEGETDLKAGDAITRTITATINGTTAVLIPALTPETATDALRPYGKEPVVTDTTERGEMSGTRVETTTYIGQQAGPATLPAVAFDWFNLTTGKVETASLPATEVTVTGTVLSSEPPSPRQIALWLGGALLCGVLLWALWRFARPRVMADISRLRARYDASERAAYRRLQKALAARDLSASLAATERWARFWPDAADASALVQAALARVGAARFGAGAGPEDAAWRDAIRAARDQRASMRHAMGRTARQGLPPLNPSA